MLSSHCAIPSAGQDRTEAYPAAVKPGSFRICLVFGHRVTLPVTIISSQSCQVLCAYFHRFVCLLCAISREGSQRNASDSRSRCPHCPAQHKAPQLSLSSPPADFSRRERIPSAPRYAAAFRKRRSEAERRGAASFPARLPALPGGRGAPPAFPLPSLSERFPHSETLRRGTFPFPSQCHRPRSAPLLRFGPSRRVRVGGRRGSAAAAQLTAPRGHFSPAAPSGRPRALPTRGWDSRPPGSPQPLTRRTPQPPALSPLRTHYL